MKKAACILVCILCNAVCLSASPWKGGYSVKIGGFSHDSMRETDTISVRLNLKLYDSDSLQVLFNTGAHASNPFQSPADFLFDTSFLFEFLLSRAHPLESFMMRESTWHLGVESGVLLPFTANPAGKLYAAISPFSFYFGEKFISVAEPLVLWDLQSNSFGWGLTILRITHFLW